MKALRLLFVVMVLLLSSSCAIYHHYGAYHGKIIDIETKEPLEGVVVLAVYYTELYTFAGTVGKYLDARETVAGKNGEFMIPSNNTFAFRPLNLFDPVVMFTIFRPGYGCYPRHKRVKPMLIPNGTLPVDQFVMIELPKVKDETREERLWNAACLPSPNVPDSEYKKLSELLELEYKSIGIHR